MIKPVKRIIPAETRAQGAELLERLARPISGLQTAVLSSADGFEIASLSQNTQISPSRLAAISSSLMAMARALGHEIKYKDCRRLIFETESGRIILLPVQASIPCILCLAIAPDAVLGSALWAADNIAREIRDTLLPAAPKDA